MEGHIFTTTHWVYTFSAAAIFTTFIFVAGIDTDSLNIETDIEEETIEFFIKEEIEVIEDGE